MGCQQSYTRKGTALNPLQLHIQPASDQMLCHCTAMYVPLFMLSLCYRFVNDGEMKSEYPIVIGGENFGCGSSREHAPVCMGAAGATTHASQLHRGGCMTKLLMQLNECPASVSCQDGCVLAGAKMVVSQSYARIFFRNCVSTYVSVHHHAMNLS